MLSAPRCFERLWRGGGFAVSQRVCCSAVQSEGGLVCMDYFKQMISRAVVCHGRPVLTLACFLGHLPGHNAVSIPGFAFLSQGRGREKKRQDCRRKRWRPWRRWPSAAIGTGWCWPSCGTPSSTCERPRSPCAGAARGEERTRYDPTVESTVVGSLFFFPVVGAAREGYCLCPQQRSVPPWNDFCRQAGKKGP